MTKVTAKIVQSKRDVSLICSDLSELITGTQKQKDWAEKIRQSFIANAQEIFRIMLCSVPKPSDEMLEKMQTSLTKNAEKLAPTLDKLTDAVWWIENRNVLGYDGYNKNAVAFAVKAVG